MNTIIQKFKNAYGYEPTIQEIKSLYNQGFLTLTDHEENQLLELLENGLEKKRIKLVNDINFAIETTIADLIATKENSPEVTSYKMGLITPAELVYSKLGMKL